MLIKVLIKKCYLEEACLREEIFYTFWCMFSVRQSKTSKTRIRDGNVPTPGFLMRRLMVFIILTKSPSILSHSVAGENNPAISMWSPVFVTVRRRWSTLMVSAYWFGLNHSIVLIPSSGSVVDLIYSYFTKRHIMVALSPPTSSWSNKSHCTAGDEYEGDSFSVSFHVL